MKITFKAYVQLAVLFIIIQKVNAQTTLTGELRPRFEYRHGFKSLIDSAESGTAFISQRTRLNFGYLSKKFRIGITLQDVRTWGSQPQSVISDGLTSFHQSWAEYFFSKKVSARFGRQELKYDDIRIFDPGNWSHQGKSHDLLLFKFTDTTFSAHVGFAYNQNAESAIATAYTVTPGYKQMQFFWLNKKLKNFNISLLLLNDGRQSPVSVNSTRYHQTFGTHTEIRSDKWFGALNLYAQTGNDFTSVTNKKIRNVKAFLIGAEVSYSITKSIIIDLGFEQSSGQSQTDTSSAYSGVNHSFNAYYGAGHKFNGLIDYFYANNHFNSVGLQDAYFRLKFYQSRWWAAIAIHSFLAAAPVLDSDKYHTTGQISAMNNKLGTEVDLTCNYTLSQQVNVQLGYAQMFATRTMQELKGGNYKVTQNWAFLMVILEPNFLQ